MTHRKHLPAAVALSLFLAGASCAAEPAPGHVIVQERVVARTTPLLDGLKACDKPVWPKHSLRMEQHGTVTLAFLIGADGTVRDTRVDKSSGYPLLDMAAAEGLAKCAFKPGTVDGAPIETWMKMQYVWTLAPAPRTAAGKVADIEKRAAQGDARAQFELARLMLNGDGVAKDADGARQWMRRAAEQGLMEAQEWMALLAQPAGAAPNEESVTWMRKAAEQGSARAQGLYGTLLIRGAGVQADVGAGVDWLSRAAQANDATAQAWLGAYLLKEQPRRAGEALTWLRKAAEQDDPHAQTLLGDCYDKGHAVEQDRAAALAWYTKAAQGGSSAAMLRLADRYQRGDGVAIDTERAMRLRTAAYASRPNAPK